MNAFIRTAVAAVAILPLLLLAACGSGPAPLPPAPAPPPQIERPGAVVFSAAWTSPSIGVGLYCTASAEGTSIDCSQMPDGVIWGTDSEPVNAQCADPGPNPCWSTDGVTLSFDAVTHAWPIIARAEFPKDDALSLEGIVSAEITDAGGFAGIVLYCGEQDYRALYIDAAGFTIYMPTIIVHLGAAGPGPHALRMDEDGKGNFRYLVDGQLRQSESPNSLSPDTTLFLCKPHPSLFVGGSRGTVGRFDLFAAPNS
jgi:hypothetical protein